MANYHISPISDNERLFVEVRNMDDEHYTGIIFIGPIHFSGVDKSTNVFDSVHGRNIIMNMIEDHNADTPSFEHERIEIEMKGDDELIVKFIIDVCVAGIIIGHHEVVATCDPLETFILDLVQNSH